VDVPKRFWAVNRQTESYTDLERQRDRIIARLQEALAPEKYLLEAVRYEGESGIIATLKRS
jgi:hypothetical protein